MLPGRSRALPDRSAGTDSASTRSATSSARVAHLAMLSLLALLEQVVQTGEVVGRGRQGAPDAMRDRAMRHRTGSALAQNVGCGLDDLASATRSPCPWPSSSSVPDLRPLTSGFNAGESSGSTIVPMSSSVKISSSIE